MSELSAPETLSDLYPPSQFIKAEILRGKDLTLKILDVRRREVEDEKTGDLKVEGYVIFERTKEMEIRKDPNQLTLNKTNGLALETMFGKRVKAWIGHNVTLMPDRDRGVEGKMVDCIRFRGSPDIDELLTFQTKRKKQKAKTHQLIKTHVESEKPKGDLDKALKLLTEAGDLNAINGIAKAFGDFEWTVDDRSELRVAVTTARADVEVTE